MGSTKLVKFDELDYETFEERLSISPPRTRTPSPKKKSPRRRLKTQPSMQSDTSTRLKLKHRIDTIESLELIPIICYKASDMPIVLTKTRLGDTIAVEGIDADVSIIELKDYTHHPTLPHYSYPLIKAGAELRSDILIVTGYGVQISRISPSSTLYYNYEECDAELGYQFKVYPLIKLSDICPVKAKDTIGDALRAAIGGVDAEAFREFALMCEHVGVLDDLSDRSIRITLIVPVSNSIIDSEMNNASKGMQMRCIMRHIVDGKVLVSKNGNYVAIDGSTVEVDAKRGKISGSQLRDINMKFSNGMIHIVDDMLPLSDIHHATNDHIDTHKGKSPTSKARRDILDLNRICNGLRDSSLHVWEDELINIETNMNNILKPCITSAISKVSQLISAGSRQVEDPALVIAEASDTYMPPKSEVWGTDEVIDSNSIDLSGSYSDAADFNHTIDKVNAIIAKIASMRVMFDAMCHELKSASSELSIHVSRGRL